VSDRVEVAEGSLEEILAGAFTLRNAQLVLANILAPVLVKLLDQGLAQLLDQDGLLVLSGIIEDQLGEIEAAAVRNSLQIERRLQIDDWVALGLKISDRSEDFGES
jgi:ribosomal protein L11 methyltransferase